MSDLTLDDLHAVLIGDAPPALAEATLAALVEAGAQAERIDDDGLAATTGIDIGVCFAAPEPGPPLAELDDAAMDAALERALTIPRRRVLRLARRMGDGRGGSIIVVGSVDATHAYPGRAAASIAMGGLTGLVRSIAVELSGSDVRANLVLVGPLAGTESHAAQDPALVERTLQRVPAGRFGTPAEVAAAVRFLASGSSDFMTGQAIRVDGGWASLNQTPDGMRFR